VEELPLLNRFYQENSPKSWQVVGVAVDKLDAVQRFLLKTPLQFPVAMAGMEGTALSRTLGNLGGGLPFTVVFDPRAKVVHRKMGILKPDELQTLVQSYSS
jgi:peroxiredoxin